MSKTLINHVRTQRQQTVQRELHARIGELPKPLYTLSKTAFTKLISFLSLSIFFFF